MARITFPRHVTHMTMPHLKWWKCWHLITHTFTNKDLSDLNVVITLPNMIIFWLLSTLFSLFPGQWLIQQCPHTYTQRVQVTDFSIIVFSSVIYIWSCFAEYIQLPGLLLVEYFLHDSTQIAYNTGYKINWCFHHGTIGALSPALSKFCRLLGYESLNS